MLNLVSQDMTTETKPVADFDTFWLLYPRRLAKKDAQRAWMKMTAGDRYDAIVALVDWIRVWKQRGDDQFTPHPATWLNGERWTDELPKEFVQRPSCQAEFKERADVPRTEMPDSVRAAIARLRKG